MPENKQIGNAMVTVEDDDFINGYQTGYLHYFTDYKGKRFTDAQLHAIVAFNINNGTYSFRYNAGYVLGWIAGMHERTTRRAKPSPPSNQITENS